MPEMINSLGPLSRHLAAFPWPGDFFDADDLPGFLDRVHLIAWERRPGGFGLSLAFEGELAVQLPGLDGVSVVFGGGVSGYTLIELSARLGDPSSLTLHNVRAALRFSPDLLTPAPDEDGVVAAHAQIYVQGSITIDDGFDVHVQGFDALQLTPVMVGSSGIVLSASDVKLDLSRTSSLPEVIAAGFDDSFLGVFIGEAKVRLPDGFPALAPEDLVLRGAAIGSGGVSGTLAATYDPTFDEATGRFVGRGAGELFGVAFGLREVDLALRANAFERARMAGELLLPFFDAPVGVELGLTYGGGLTVDLASEDGLATLRKEGVVELQVESLGFEVTGDRFAARVSGKLTPLAGGLAWPAFQIEQVVIDSDGNVELDGGWLDLPEQYRLDFHGFGFEISKLGFGRTDDGGKWIGFSGGLALAAELRAGASVEGLRVVWYDDGRDPKLTLEGVSVQLDIPDVLRFDGRVAYRELEVDGQTVHRFDGAIALELVALELTVDGQLVIGRADGEAFLAIHLGAELPAGIPLFATGLALYGLEAMFALGMEPDRRPDEAWYDGWYKRAPAGASELAKWTQRPGALAFGGGATIGTVSDNGFMFAARTVLAVVFPGPILIIEGKANLLRKRTTLADEPMFRALAVLDRRTDTFLVGLDARYRYGAGGELIDLAGSAEAFFRLSSGDAWHVYLGQREPRARRIRAEVLSLVEGDAYFMLDPQGLAMGASAGWGRSWKFGPLRVTLEAWLEANAALSWRPPQFHGDVWIHGTAALGVYGFGAELGVDARLAADVFEPFHVVGEFSVGIGLPWPLPDFDVDITLEWGPAPVFPALPAPLEEIAVEHFKVTTTWPLPAGELVLPRLDRGDGFFDPAAPVAPAPDAAPPPAGAPVVPLDARPHLTFSRAMHDDADAGVNGRETVPAWVRIGDPAAGEGPVRVRFGLRELALEAWQGGAWQLVARSIGSTHPAPNPPGTPRLYGSWAPTPNLPDLGGESVAQVKLWLWSKTPFDWSRTTGATWDEWFTDEFEDYPCPDRPPRELVCWDFSSVALGDELATPWIHPDEPELTIAWAQPVPLTVLPVAGEDGVRVPGLCLPVRSPAPNTHATTPNAFLVRVPLPNVGVRLGVRDPEGVIVAALAADGTVVGPIVGGGEPAIHLPGADLRYVAIYPRSRACLYRICVVRGLTDDELDRREEMAEHMRGELVRWSQEDHVLAPDRAYRLRIVTTVEARGEAELSDHAYDVEHVQLAYFRTEGPPGLAALSPPSAGELDHLGLYVRQTTPPTKPAGGEPPVHVKFVYRAYDVGVAFNENHVALMYRLARRDVGLYLFDANNRPARDAAGRLLAAPYRWDLTPDVPLTEAESWWITVVNESTCASFDTTTIIRDTAMSAAGHVLEPELLHEARLIPLLFHDDFTALPAGVPAIGSGATLGGWTVRDQSPVGGPGRWVPIDDPGGRALAQTSNVGGGTSDPGDARKPGTLLVRGGDHGDGRASAYLRSAGGGALGLAVRVVSETRHLLFTMDRVGRYRRLIRVFDDEWTILAEDDFVYAVNRDYHVAIDTVGEDVRVFVDGDPVFAVRDPSYATGGVALYAWRCPDARFKDVRVDDLGAAAPVVHRFAFTTSRFASFTHHVHSHQDDVWPAPPLDAAALLAPAVDPALPPGDDEARAYEALAEAALGAAARSLPPSVRITRLADAGLLIETSEPIDWRRLTVAAGTSPRRLPPPVPPAGATTAKLVGAAFADLHPSGERAAVLLRAAAEPSSLRVERLALPGPLDEGAGDDLLHAEELGEHPSGVLLEERFGASALDRYHILDEGANAAPSAWSAEAGRLRQTSNIWGGQVSASSPAKPGTLAMTGDPAWRNVRVSATIRSTDNDAIGVAVRCGDGGDGYRFVMDSERAYRRLLRVSAGATTILWEDGVAYAVGRAYRVVIEAFEAVLVVWVDDMLLCAVIDDELAAGRVGLFAWANQGASFEALRVDALERPPILWAPDAADPAAWRTCDAGGPAQLGGDDAWDDVTVSVTLRSLAGAPLGVLFRVVDEHTHYRLVLDPASGVRRLVRSIEDVETTLWEGAGATAVGVAHRLTVRAVGGELTAILGGELLYRVYDRAIGEGGVGLLGRGGAVFTDVFVGDARRMLDGWRIVDEGTIGGPSRWHLGSGGLSQRSAIRGGSEDGSDPAKPGTYAVGGPGELADVRFEATLRSDEDGAIGVVFRWLTVGDHYRLSFDRGGGYRRLIRKQGGLVTTLWEAAGSYVPGTTFRVTIDAAGARLVGWLDGELLFDLRDGALAHGSIGFYAWHNAGARFERFALRRPPLSARLLFADRFDGGSLADWTVEDQGTSLAPSSWTAGAGVARQTSNIFSPPLDAPDPAKLGTQLVAGDATWTDVVFSVRLRSTDDDAIGVVFRHQAADRHYRFSMDRERSYRRLVKRVGAAFTVLWEDTARPDTARPSELAIVAIGGRLRGFLDGVPMFDVIDDELPSGRIGLYCWGNHDARFAQVRVHEAVARFAAWTLEDGFAAVSGFRWSFAGAGRWSAAPGWLVQGEAAEAFAIAGDGPRGDLRVAVRARTGEGIVGVAVAWRGVDDHVRFELDVTSGVYRLITRAGGVSTTRGETAAAVAPDRDYLVTVDHVGTRLVAYVDAIPIFALDDAPPAGGRLALHTSGTTSARFTDLRAAPPRWTPYASFEGEAAPAGTRLDARPDDMARFLGGDVRLRVVERGPRRDRVLHERSFLPAPAYAPAPIRVLRRRDGAGLAIAIPLAPGQLRLAATYARTGVPDAPDLSEAGSTDPEETFLDVGL